MLDFTLCLCCVFFLVDLTFISLESAPAPDTTSVKKIKSASSAEEEDKEMFVLHVSKGINYCKAVYLHKISVFAV